jgi:hypothetical protein
MNNSRACSRAIANHRDRELRTNRTDKILFLNSRNLLNSLEHAQLLSTFTTRRSVCELIRLLTTRRSNSQRPTFRVNLLRDIQIVVILFERCMLDLQGIRKDSVICRMYNIYLTN